MDILSEGELHRGSTRVALERARASERAAEQRSASGVVTRRPGTHRGRNCFELRSRNAAETRSADNVVSRERFKLVSIIVARQRNGEKRSRSGTRRCPALRERSCAEENGPERKSSHSIQRVISNESAMLSHRPVERSLAIARPAIPI